MKYIGIFLALLSLNVVAGDLGIGAMIGSPTGLSAKYKLGDGKAIDGGFGMTLGRNSKANIHSDYLFHTNDALYFDDKHPLDLYYGMGGRMKFDDDIVLGVRLPLGLLYEVEKEGADVFGEIAPVVDFIGKVGLDLHLAIGARYYFR
jgi:hypothetical protein